MKARLPGLITAEPLALANLAKPNAEVTSTRFPQDTGALLRTGRLTASVTRDNVAGKETARAQISDAEAGALGLGLTARTITANCNATIGGKTVGWAQLDGGKIRDSVLGTTPAPNTVLSFPEGPSTPRFWVTLNEQYKFRNVLTVNAVHVRWAGGAGDLILGSARCGACPPPKPPPVPLASGPGLFLGLGASAMTAAAFLRKRRRGGRVALTA